MTLSPPSAKPKRKKLGLLTRHEKIDNKKLVVNDEHDGWESDEEAEYNRIGDVPLRWYQGQDHIGYDIGGEKVPQVFGIKDSEIDRLIANADDPDAWRTIIDVKNQTKTLLSARDLEVIRRIREGKLGVRPVKEFEFEFPWDQGHMPLVNKGLRKSQFVPSKHEEKQIQHFIRLIRTGKLYKPPEPEPDVYDLWGSCIIKAPDEKLSTRSKLIAPKLPTPNHAESYNPPSEYLVSNEEKEAWENQHPDDRVQDFLPQKYSCLRHVPGFDKLLLQRFKRCLDLYLCPRTVRTLNVTSLDEILPELPPLNTFYPFPSRHGFTLKESGSCVTSVSISADQTLLMAGCEDGSVSMHIMSQRPYTLPLFYFKSSSRATAFKIQGAQFHPQLNIVAFGRTGYMFVCLLRDVKLGIGEIKDLLINYWKSKSNEDAETMMDIKPRFRRFVESVKLMRFSSKEIPRINAKNRPNTISGNRNWRSFKSEFFFKGLEDIDEDESIETDLEETEDVGHATLHSKDWEETNKMVALMQKSKWIVSGFVVRLGAAASSLDFHHKGIYIATTSPAASNKSNQILLHSLKKKLTLRSFSEAIKSDRIRSARFHPTEPWMCLGLDKFTRIYSLIPSKSQDSSEKQTGGQIKEFHGTNTAGDLAVHGTGKHILRVTDDGKLVWYDTELGTTPYKIMKLTQTEAAGLTTVQIHNSKPLVAVGTSEGFVQLLHASIDPESFLEDVEIMPLIRLKEQKSAVRSMAWFSSKHWLATGHSDGKLVVWI
eukprot:Gregarina_sp_Poly_1__776@NODE_1186_length_4833_cov_42_703735_g419_i1_p1_GENE_NODE_1186_length_4833_cov_42_703735_g419_i1NODE_1186_length_4833_cov_42_703735_g419_i1_p1_ORF_typecomplete_len765_score114_19BOP1NT/PF08145_12/3_1e73ANAPC4_WD40/PF12894_7/0_0011ANAPC4_WD40/PF12894_7/21ANAPC4_WD40/PF12894_7/1_3e02ANAPC4_WD40/PF12894_7/68ANAPC4_WD40/PF12894_7/2_9ANAPC4_WD40/PF12894_7/9_1e06WD40/PF00400_32/0_0045WD40/PF00400_32/2_3e02WD40/PF00400_32/6_7e02WD40/PF00400_32/0_00019Frtz/PF11768_8/0_1Frtz/PF117